ncbi:MAG TPA: hypothetical protein PLF80_12240 [Flavobacteriales bacterium]|nr:hypothetical protein [Flavobacteriales bacterium]
MTLLDYAEAHRLAKDGLDILEDSMSREDARRWYAQAEPGPEKNAAFGVMAAATLTPEVTSAIASYLVKVVQQDTLYPK